MKNLSFLPPYSNSGGAYPKRCDLLLFYRRILQLRVNLKKRKKKTKITKTGQLWWYLTIINLLDVTE
jgi:hypothetical protein